MVAEVQLHIALLGNAHGVGQGFGHMGKGLFHLFDGFVVQLMGAKAHALGVVHGGLRLNAEQHFVGFGIVSGEVVAVVGGNQRHARGFRQFQQGGVGLGLLGQAVGLQFQIEAVGVDIGVFPREAQGLVHVVRKNGAGDFARNAGRKADKAFGILAQQGFIHAGFVIKTLKVALCDQLDQIVVARGVLGQQNQVVAAARQGRLRAFILVVVADVNLAPKDGFDAVILATLIKIGRAKEVAVVGDGAGGHAEILGAGAQILDADGAVKQAVFGMAMKMDKI